MKPEEKSMQRYGEVRKVLAAPYRNMSSEQIERMMESYNVNAEDMENFLSMLGNIGRSVVSALPQVLPAALPLIGTAIGGPAGGAIGGVAGQALGAMLGPRQPQGAQPSAGLPAPMPGGSPAAGQLLQTLFQPQVLQGLMSMLMGGAGRQNIPVGRTQVPAPAFANLIGVLANQAASEASANAAQDIGGESVPRYLQNYAGEAVGDPAIPEHRAYALLELLQEAQAEQDESDDNRADSARESWFRVPELDEAYFDELELAELYGEYDLA
jgi:hypothetical protein